jgi:hypothetical protein
VSILELRKLNVLKRHLELAIGDEVRKRIPDPVRLTRLKKLRLSVKDKMVAGVRSKALA